jgi:hypothetical protein
MTWRGAPHPFASKILVLAAFRQVIERYGVPASVLTDSGLVYTTRRHLSTRARCC